MIRLVFDQPSGRSHKHPVENTTTKLITYHVSFLIFFSVICFILALSILVYVGCAISDTMCTDPKKSTMSEIVDQPEIYQWFAVLSTINVIILFYAMFHYIDPIRVIPGKERLSYYISVAVLVLQSIASVLFLAVILLPITIHPETHVIVVQIAFGFILCVHIVMWLRSFLCEYGEYHNTVLSIQIVHLLTVFALAGAYLFTENGWIEIAFILITISYYVYLAYEYWNVSVTLVVNNPKDKATSMLSKRFNRTQTTKRRYG